jgi:hypothetical protein
MLYYIDIDDTLCRTPQVDGEPDYYSAVPNELSIQKVNAFYERGHTIVIWTSRGMGQKYDVRSVNHHMRCNRLHKLTESQLAQWGVKYHHLRMDKPIFDLLIDDKAGRIEEIS